MLSSKQLRSLAVYGVTLAAVALSPRQARAEEIFPAVIQKDANMPCAPSCTLCHTTNPGEAGTWAGKKFGFFMQTNGAMKGDANSITTAYNAYVARVSAGVPAGMIPPQLAALQRGEDPDNGTSLCGPSYGCGAHIAKQKAAPRDLTAPLWIVGAMAVAGLLRRRKKVS
jgi:hypothetical protein